MLLPYILIWRPLQATIRKSNTLLAAHVDTLLLPSICLGEKSIRVQCKRYSVNVGTKLFNVLYVFYFFWCTIEWLLIFLYICIVLVCLLRNWETIKCWVVYGSLRKWSSSMSSENRRRMRGSCLWDARGIQRGMDSTRVLHRHGDGAQGQHVGGRAGGPGGGGGGRRRRGAAGAGSATTTQCPPPASARGDQHQHHHDQGTTRARGEHIFRFSVICEQYTNLVLRIHFSYIPIH